MSNYTPHTWVDGSVGTPLSAARLNELEAGVVAVDTAQAARQPALAPTAVKTTAYTAAVGDLVPVDLTSSNVTVTLPAAPTDKSQVAVKVVTAGASHSLTVSASGSDVFNKTAGVTTLSFSLVNQGAILQYRASGAIWYVISEYVPISGLDGRYVASVTAGDSSITLSGTVANPIIAVSTATLAAKADTTAIIPASLITAKGDIISASGSGVPQRLAVGTDGQVLVVDSAQTLGVKWSSAGAGVTSVTAADTSITIAGSATTPTVAVGISASRLTPTAVKTSAYSAAAGEFVPVSTAGGAVTVTLPASAADLTQVGVKHVTQGSTNAVTVAASGTDRFNVASTGSTSITLPLLRQGVTCQYRSATGVWYVLATDVGVSELDARYQPLDSDLTTIAGLTANTDSFLQAKASAWAARTPSQVQGDLGIPDTWPLTSGESTVPRSVGLQNSNAVTTGNLTLTYFTARKTETITQIRVISATAAGATPTLVRFGVYTEDSGTGDLTLVVSIANDTTLLATANTEYVKSFTGSLSKVSGLRYAIGMLVVTGAALPSLQGLQVNNTSGLGATYGRAPRICGQVTGQTDLPGSVSNGSITSPAPRIQYAELLP